MSTSYRKRYKTYKKPYKKRLYYPRGVTSTGQYKSRAPYRVLNPSMTPELKYSDTNLLPFPFGYGNVNGTYKWVNPPGGSIDPYQWWAPNPGGLTPQNSGLFILGSNPSVAADDTNGNFQSGLFQKIPQNSSATGRIGQKIFAKSMYIQMTIRSPIQRTVAGTVDGNNVPLAYRIVAILDKQPNSNPIPTANYVFEPIVHNNNNYVQVLSPRNLDNRDRFTTLFDIKDTLSPQSSECRTYEKFQKLNFQVTFAANGGVSTNDIYIYFISDGVYGNIQDNAQPTSNTIFLDTRPYCKINVRIRYTDV